MEDNIVHVIVESDYDTIVDVNVFHTKDDAIKFIHSKLNSHTIKYIEDKIDNYGWCYDFQYYKRNII